MNIRPIAAVFVFSLFASVAAAWAVPAIVFDEPDSTQFLLLKNGQVIEGVVELGASSELSLVISKKSGSKIYLDRNKIIAVADSRVEIYWQKCALLSATDSAGHKRLFEWCVEHKLLEAAQNQIELLQFMDVSAEKLLALVDKLEQATVEHEQRLNAEKYATHSLPKMDPPGQPKHVELAESNAIGDAEHQADVFKPDHIQQVGYEAPVEISDRLKLIERLERATDSIDGEAVVMFKRKIEPLLINSCYTAKCHSNDAMPLPLATLGNRQRMPRRMSQRNLYNVLKFTDFNQPLESKLLSAAALPHAGQSSPIIKINSPQFQNLKVWLIGISSTPFVYHQVPNVFLESDTKVAVSKPDANAEVKANTSGESGIPAKAPKLESIKKIPGSEKSSQGVASKKHHRPFGNDQESGSKDPFDPHVFNRLHLKKQETATKESDEPSASMEKEDTGT